MRFLMFVCTDPDLTDPDPGGMEIDEWVDTLDASGVRLLGERVQGDAAAKTVRVRSGETVVTDGPFVETKEVLAGFDVLECRDLAHAVEVAAAHPMAHSGVIELRPFWDWDGEG